MEFSDRSVTIWSDYLCPFCWVARPRVAWLESLGVPIDWQPYELHAEIPRSGISRAALRDSTRAGRVGQIRSLAEEEGVDLAYPDLVPNTRLAHEASEWARSVSTDAHECVHAAIFEAYWVMGRDIGSIDVLAAVTDAAGLDATTMRDAVESGDYFGDVEASRARAREHGVTGTPAFLVVRGETEFLVPGLQSEAFLRRVIERIGGS